RAPLDLGPEAFDGGALAGRPGALDELHHADAKAAPQRPQGKSEGRSRFALAGTGVNDEETFFQNRFRSHLGVLGGLSFGHFGFVAVVFGAAHGAIPATARIILPRRAAASAFRRNVRGPSATSPVGSLSR